MRQSLLLRREAETQLRCDQASVDAPSLNALDSQNCRLRQVFEVPRNNDIPSLGNY